MTDDRILLGMHRPEWIEIVKQDRSRLIKDRVNSCPGCGCNFEAVASRIHTSCETVRRTCWQNGHFDTPVYATREEVLDRMARQAMVVTVRQGVAGMLKE